MVGKIPVTLFKQRVDYCFPFRKNIDYFYIETVTVLFPDGIGNRRRALLVSRAQVGHSNKDCFLLHDNT